jgi:hypothetical protein
VHRLALVVVLLCPAAALAKPDQSSFYGMAAVGFNRVNAPSDIGAQYGGFAWELAVAGRWRDLWFRGAVSEGQMFMNTDGHILEPRIGVELRTRSDANAAAFVGIDAGRVDGWADDDYGGRDTVKGWFAMPRIGIELGGTHVRFHLAFELLVGYGTSTSVGPAESGTGRLGGGDLMLGLSVR